MSKLDILFLIHFFVGYFLAMMWGELAEDPINNKMVWLYVVVVYIVLTLAREFIL